jgi:hypothetical protein
MFQLDEFVHWASTFYHFGHISAPLSLTLLCCACWVSAYSLLVISEIVAVPHLHVSTNTAANKFLSHHNVLDSLAMATQILASNLVQKGSWTRTLEQKNRHVWLRVEVLQAVSFARSWRRLV